MAVVECQDADAEGTCHYLMTRDISGSGVYFQSPAPLSIDAQVRIQIFLDVNKLSSLPVGGHVLVVADGRVLRCDDAGLAVQFHDSCKVVSVN